MSMVHAKLAHEGAVGRWLLALIAMMAAEVCAAGDASLPEAERAKLEFFESRVRPILVQRCQECHGPEKQESGFALVSREALLAGGQSGPAVVPGMPDESLLIQAVRHEGREMPLEGKLADDEIAVLEQWVRDGAAWTTMGGGELLGDQERLFEQAKSHWAFQPVRKPPVPAVARKAAVATPIDAFLLAKLEAADLEPAPRAAPRTSC